MQSSPSNTLSYKNDPQISQYEITPYKSSNKQITSMKLPNNTDLDVEQEETPAPSECNSDGSENYSFHDAV